MNTATSLTSSYPHNTYYFGPANESVRDRLNRLVYPAVEKFMMKLRAQFGGRLPSIVRTVSNSFECVHALESCQSALAVRPSQRIQDRAQELLTMMFDASTNLVHPKGPLRNITFPLSVNQTVTAVDLIGALRCVAQKGLPGWITLPKEVQGTLAFCVMTAENNIVPPRF